jgi:hypothetical protein
MQSTLTIISILTKYRAKTLMILLPSKNGGGMNLADWRFERE